ncbi:MAG TPA: hypothetical protein VFA07_13000 [Chthonomonadaceae bacterium]|nr:hypothetical protein [Chthonomonadaceae bacterium]
MSRIQATVSGIATGVILAALLSSGPAADAQKSGAIRYYPLHKGNSWTYSCTANGRTFTEVATVTQASSSQAQIDWKVNGQTLQMETYLIRPDALLRAKSGPNGGGQVTPPFPQIRTPLKAGQQWTWKGSVSIMSHVLAGSATIRVSGPESIKTPAGTFRCMHIHSDLTLNPPGQPSLSLLNDYWFAAGVGLVAQQLSTGSLTINGKLSRYQIK